MSLKVEKGGKEKRKMREERQKNLHKEEKWQTKDDEGEGNQDHKEE